MLAAARFGIPVAGGLIYTTIQPGFGCPKEMVQAHIEGVRHRRPWSHPDKSLRPQDEALKAQFPAGVKQILTPDPREAWALGKGVSGGRHRPFHSDAVTGARRHSPGSALPRLWRGDRPVPPPSAPQSADPPFAGT